MKLVIFGANGGVGREVVAQAVKAGHEVIGVVRDPTDKADMPTAGVKLITGSVTDTDFVAKVAKGCDVVVSTVGTLQYKRSVSLYSDGATALIQGMKKASVSRLIVLSAGAATVESNDPWPFRLIFKPILRRRFHFLYEDMLRMERLLESSNLDWTIIRLSYLANKPVTGRYRTKIEGGVRYGFTINRSDVAHYIVHHAIAPSTYRHHVGIAN